MRVSSRDVKLRYEEVSTKLGECQAAIGSGRVNQGKKYGLPYRCNQCQIMINVDLPQEKRKCTQCAGSEINTYATPTTPCPMPILEKLNDWWLSLFGWHRLEDEYHSAFSYELNSYFVLLRGMHKYPKCKANKLMFSTKIMF